MHTPPANHPARKGLRRHLRVIDGTLATPKRTNNPDDDLLALARATGVLREPARRQNR